jgi:hypothetical protein
MDWDRRNPMEERSSGGMPRNAPTPVLHSCLRAYLKSREPAVKAVELALIRHFFATVQNTLSEEGGATPQRRTALWNPVKAMKSNITKTQEGPRCVCEKAGCERWDASRFSC